jgi:hypothetical protein
VRSTVGCWTANVSASLRPCESTLRADRPTVDGKGGGYGHASWRPSGPGPVGALAVTFCAVTDTADLVDITLNGQPYHPLAVRYPDQGLRRPQDRHQEFLSQPAPAAVQSVKARYAVNYGIDRSRIIQLLHGGHSRRRLLARSCRPGQAANGATYQPQLNGRRGPA